MDTRIQKEFVRRALIETGANINKAQLRAIHKYIHFNSPNGIYRHKVGHGSYDVKTGENFDGKLTINHPIHERFIDMKRLTSPSGRKYKRRVVPIHNRIIWGNLPVLVNKLMYGLTETAVQEIKSDFEI